ncbi:MULTISPECIES: hypothetical protein [Acetomicrobium]|uniref:hypothetical protein n=1 Tax=Acetomicrobium TaxID=49894 RepID=UPI0026EA7763|nr:MULTISPECIES: hypothetical protein [Acetomicrobium]
MERLREEYNGRLVVIDDDMFFADGVRYPLSSIWGVKGVYYKISESVGSAVVEGVGTVASSAAGCILGPIFGLCILGIGIIIVASMLGADMPVGAAFLLAGIACVCFLIIRGISSGAGAAAKAAAKKTYYLVISTQTGEVELLEGFPLETLQKVASVLGEMIAKDVNLAEK